MSRESKLVKNTLILSIGSFLPKLATFITLPILTGCLTQEDYGTYDLIVVLVSLFLPSLTLQIQTAAFRFLIDVRDKKEEASSVVTNTLAFTIPIAVAGVIIAFFCLYQVDVFVRLAICLYFLLDITVAELRQVTRGFSSNLKYSVSAIISSGSQMLFVVVFVWYFRIGLLGAIFALVIAEALSILYLLVSMKLYRYFDFKKISASEIKRMLAYSWPMVPNCMSMWVMRLSNRLIVTFFMGVSANAVFAVANKIPQLLTLAQQTFTMAWQENASIVSKDKDADKYYSDMHKNLFNLMAGAMCLIIACIPVLFRILIKGDYAEAYIHIPIILLGMFFYAMSAFLGGVYVAYMKTKSVGITTIVSAALNVVIIVSLIHWIGLYAASLALLLSYATLYVYRMVDVKKIIQIQYDKKHMLLTLIVMLVVVGVCMLQNPIANIVNFVLSVAVFIFLNKKFLRGMLQMVRKKIGR